MMSEIKASQIIQWQNEIQKKGYSDSYLRMIQNQLTSLFTHAAKIYDLPDVYKRQQLMSTFRTHSVTQTNRSLCL